jgi:hypothetical protein
MTAIQYIKDGIKKLANQFPQVQIRYAFNYEINTHIIQFDPIDAYYYLPELDAAWIPFSLEFDEIYADESIAFIGSDSILSLTDNFEISWNIHAVDLTFQYFKKLLANSDFGGFISTFPATVDWNPGLLNNSGFIINTIDLKVTTKSISHFLFENSYLGPEVIIQQQNRGILENEKYAMAA